MIYDKFFADDAKPESSIATVYKRVNRTGDGVHAAVAGGIGAVGGGLIARAIAKKKLANQGIYPGDPEYKSKLRKAMLIGAAGGGLAGAGTVMGVKTYRNINRYNKMTDPIKKSLEQSVGKKLSFVDKYRMGAAMRDVDKMNKWNPTINKETGKKIPLIRQVKLGNKYGYIFAPNHDPNPLRSNRIALDKNDYLVGKPHVDFMD